MKPIHRSDGVVLRSIAGRLAGVVGRLQKRLGRLRNGDPVATARYHIADYATNGSARDALRHKI